MQFSKLHSYVMGPDPVSKMRNGIPIKRFCQGQCGAVECGVIQVEIYPIHLYCYLVKIVSDKVYTQVDKIQVRGVCVSVSQGASRATKMTM